MFFDKSFISHQYQPISTSIDGACCRSNPVLAGQASGSEEPLARRECPAYRVLTSAYPEIGRENFLKGLVVNTFQTLSNPNRLPQGNQIHLWRRAGIFLMRSVAIRDFSPISRATSSPANPWR